MALAPNALTTVAAVADELGAGAATATIERLINVASGAIERFCDRPFRRASRVERLAGPGTLRLVLPVTPLVEIESITDDGSTVSEDTYEIEDAEAGIVLGTSIWPTRDLVAGIAQDAVRGTGPRSLEVTYVAGYVLPKDATDDEPRTLPYDLEEACILTVVSLYRARGADRRIASEAVGDASVTYGGVNSAIGRGVGGVIPDEAAVMLAPYRRVVMV